MLRVRDKMKTACYRALTALKQHIVRQKKQWCVAIFFAALIIFLAVFHTFFNPLLQYDYLMFSKHQYWRVITAHFVHLNFYHALMNLAAAALILSMFSEFITAFWWVCLTLFLSLCVSLGLYFFDHNVHYYVGFSGVLYGLWMCGALICLRHIPFISAAICCVLIYTVWQQQAENFDTGYLDGWINGQVIVNAHLYGFVSGIICALLYWLDVLIIGTLRGKGLPWR